MVSIADIKTRAQKFLPSNYTITDADAYEWANDAINDVGSDASVEGLHIYAATADVKYSLPSDFVDVVKVFDSDGDEYTDYEIANGYIEFGTDDTYELWHRRLPGPLTHKQDDTANVVTTDIAEDEDTLVALANALKAAHNTHIASTTYHLAADSTNAVTSNNSTDEASAITLINELKGDLVAHRSQTGVHVGTDINVEVQYADADDSASAYLLANELKQRLNLHLHSGLTHQAYHRAIALYLAYQYRTTQKPDSNHASLLYSQYLAAKADAGLSLGFYSRGTDKVKGWW